MTHDPSADARPPHALWGAILSLALGITSLLITELLPVSVLTPMADDLGVSQGLAGQSLTITAFVAIFSSLFFTRLTRGLDRRQVVMAFTATLVVANLMVAFAPGFYMLMAGRVLLGVALGGYWAMTPAVTMRLAPESTESKALSVVFGGVSVALVIAAPVGSYLGALIGWRGVFCAAAALGAVGVLWQAYVLPSMPSSRASRVSDIWEVATRPGVGIVMVAMFCVFGGQFTFFSYMRPYYEEFVGLSVSSMSAVFLVFGLANIIGTSISSFLLDRSLKATLAISPIIIGLAGFGLVFLGPDVCVVIALTATWGFVFGTVPVGWSTWITRNLPNDAENGGGLQVAVIQLANAGGAAIGGILLDFGTATTPVIAASLAMIVAAGVTVWRVETR